MQKSWTRIRTLLPLLFRRVNEEVVCATIKAGFRQLLALQWLGRLMVPCIRLLMGRRVQAHAMGTWPPHSMQIGHLLSTAVRKVKRTTRTWHKFQHQVRASSQASADIRLLSQKLSLMLEINLTHRCAQRRSRAILKSTPIHLSRDSSHRAS